MPIVATAANLYWWHIERTIQATTMPAINAPHQKTMTNPHPHLSSAVSFAVGRLEGLAATTRFDTHEFHQLIRKEVKDVALHLEEALHHFDHAHSTSHHKK